MAHDAFSERRDTLSQVIAHILDGMRDGTYRGGERLPTEPELGTLVGVSRTPVREAVKVLETLGILEVRRGVGTFLRADPMAALGQLMLFQSHMRNTSPRKLYEARLMVERTAARLLASTRSDEDLDALRQANERMRMIASSDAASLDALTEADIEFHYLIFDRCGNEFIGTLGRFVTVLFAPWIKESLRHGGGHRAAQNHDMLIGMIELKNAGGASEATIDRAVEDGLEYWQESLGRKDDAKHSDNT